MCLFGRWAFLRMQGKLCGDTWLTGFPAHSGPRGPGKSRRETADVRSMLDLCCWFCLCVCALYLWGCSPTEPWSTAPAARGLYWTAFCSTCWIEPGTSSACSAASANVIWRRNVFLERGDCTAKMTSLGKIREGKRITPQLCFSSSNFLKICQDLDLNSRRNME